MITTLYITRNGLLEPLGESQVLAYLRGLSRDYQITLITYEKGEDRADPARIAAARAECVKLGIGLLPHRFIPHPRIIAPAFSMARMVWLTVREARRSGAQLIHARSLIPTAVAMVAGRLTGTPFIFDLRALGLEELITAGKLKRGSLLYRVMRAWKRACLRNAAGTVSLAHAAVDYLQREYASELSGRRIVVIPTCADLDRVTPAKRTGEARMIGCLGTMLSGWFRRDWFDAFLNTALQHEPDLKVQLTICNDPVALGASLPSLVKANVTIVPANPREIPEILRGQLRSVMFFTQGLGNLGSSPTRMGEVLGWGLTIVANEGVGDVARIIREYRVDVLVQSAWPEDMNAGWAELHELLADPELASRCRAAAEANFSLEIGTEACRRLFSEIVMNARSKRIEFGAA